MCKNKGVPLTGDFLEDLAEAGGAGRAPAQPLLTPATSHPSSFASD